MQHEDDPMRPPLRGTVATTEAPKRGARRPASGRGRSLQGRAAAPRMSSARRATSAAKPATPKKGSGRKVAPR